GADNEHPGYASELRGQQHVADLVHAIQNSPDWAHTAIIVTYDENGGRWDHVSPPNANGAWGDGNRIPALVISPYAKKGFVDHTQYDTLSIMKTLEERYGLNPLNEHDAHATSLANSFQKKANVSIGLAYAQSNADQPGTFTLIVQGTVGGDHILISKDPSGQIRAQLDGPAAHVDQLFANISRIEVYGLGGDDQVTIGDNVTVPALV